jgi:hypothetical protein
MNPHRARVLAELGLVRYRLRSPSRRVPSDASAPDAIATTDVILAEADHAPRPAQAQVAPRPTAVLMIHVPDTGGEPVTADAAVRVWQQVLAWLRLDERDVAWSSTPDGSACVLPASHEWSTPQGKRGLWLALKAFAVTRVA